MIKPKALRAGDRVAVVSLSSGMAGEPVFLPRFERGLQRLRSEFSLEPVVMPNALKGAEFIYNHPEARAADLHHALKDDSIRAIICAIGGEDAVRMIPHVDFDLIRNNPKIFMGYSDSTANHFMFHHAGVVSFYGANVLVEFAENVAMHEYTKRHIRKTLFEPQARLEILQPESWTNEYLEWSDPSNDNTARELWPETHGYELLQGEGVVRGALLGGNLGVMQMINATRIWPAAEQWRGKILYIETAEDEPAPESLRYVLRNLAAQGVIAQIAGVVVGKAYGERYYEEYKNAYRAVIGQEERRPNLPILYNVPCSHNAPNSLLPHGAELEINCAKKTLAIIEPAVLPR